MSRRAPIAVVVVEVPAEALLVGEAGDAHDHRVAELAGAEELERRGLAADLVEGVVDVGEVLDLRHRQQADVRRALGDAEDARLVEQRVEHARLAEALLQAVGDVVDAALAPDVLAEDEQLGSPEQLVGRAPRSARRRGCGWSARWPPRAACGPNDAARSSRDGERDRGPHRHPLRMVGAIGATTSSVVCSRGRRVASSATAMHAVARLAHEVAEHLRVGGAELDQPARVAQERVARLDRLDLGERAVGLLGVAAGVAPQPHGAEVQERRPPVSGARARSPCRRRSQTSSISPSASEVRQVRLVAERVARSSPRASGR